MKAMSSLVLAARSMPRAISSNCARCSLLGALGAGAAQQALDLAPHLEHQELTARIDIGDENALARQDGDQPLARQPLQGFADRRAADLKAADSILLGENVAGLEPQRDDLLLDQPISLLGERVARYDRFPGCFGADVRSSHRAGASHVRPAFVFRP